MFSFERFFAVLKKYVRNRARPEGNIARVMWQRRSLSFVLTMWMNFARSGFQYHGMREADWKKSTLGKKSINANDHASLSKAHFMVLQQSALVASYIEEHKQNIQSKYLGSLKPRLQSITSILLPPGYAQNLWPMSTFMNNLPCWPGVHPIQSWQTKDMKLMDTHYIQDPRTKRAPIKIVVSV
jgi:hypothetical protein